MGSVYEEGFQGFSYGFRLGRSQHSTLDAVYIARCRHLNVHLQGAWLRSVVCPAWFKSLRRRSQKATKLNWFKFQWLIRRYMPSVKNIPPYPSQRFYV